MARHHIASPVSSSNNTFMDWIDGRGKLLDKLTSHLVWTKISDSEKEEAEKNSQDVIFTKTETLT